MKIIRATLLAIGATLLLVPLALAQWPTTCVELNDIVEAHLGNTNNVGIYQRVFRDQAEQACQNDHREDVRGTFAWALPEVGQAPATPSVTPTADPTPGTVQLRFVPTREELEEIARERRASPEKARQIAQAVIETGTENLFAAGLHRNIEHGVSPDLRNLLESEQAQLLNVPDGIGFFETHDDKIGETRGAYYTYTTYPDIPYGTYEVALKWERNLNNKGQPTNLALSINSTGIVRVDEDRGDVDQFWSSTASGEYRTTFTLTRDWLYKLRVTVSGSEEITYRLEILRQP